LFPAMSTPKYSIVIPVYNRPDELRELLESLTKQTFSDFEVLIVEDGSTKRSESVYEAFSKKLRVKYFTKPNTGPGPSRNFGFQHATGEYFVVFDSDCILPPEYFSVVDNHLKAEPLDAWGGPDRGRADFSALQQAMGYTMSSVLTTGGIRGGKNQAAKFQPRSFNMGFSRKVWEATGGFKFERLAEDIELSVRMRKDGFRVGLIPDAFVYHKRRTSLSAFFKQVRGFGAGRVRVGKVHPTEVKPIHWLPTLILLDFFLLPFAFLINSQLVLIGYGAYLLYWILLTIDCFRVTGSIGAAILSAPSAMTQFFGYGWGFLRETFRS
jgi:glycosyltransferase involved in cell wall biosynthesis